MCELYSTNKWKSKIFGKIINKISGILINQRLLIVLAIHKVSYSSSSPELKIIRKYWVPKDKKDKSNRGVVVQNQVQS